MRAAVALSATAGSGWLEGGSARWQSLALIIPAVAQGRREETKRVGRIVPVSGFRIWTLQGGGSAGRFAL
ncbi:MAG: hypothetical protein K9N62_17390, partial [Verrucomicrobia bacterium]|nr:hypothetical protein [Verrucomicrobiota bacterium]